MSVYSQKVDDALTSKAAEKMRKLLLAKSYLERWEPVQKELTWFIATQPDHPEHNRILPEYCYNIFDLYGRTILREIRPFKEIFKFKNAEQARPARNITEAKAAMDIDWRKFGSLLSVGERAFTFFKNEAIKKFNEDGVLHYKKKEINKLFKLLIGDKWLKERVMKVRAESPEKTMTEILSVVFGQVDESLGRNVNEWHDRAKEWDNAAVKEYHAGVSTGSEGFINRGGELAGQNKLKLAHTYDLLLLCWPEIEEMMNSVPPKTRNDLWQWLMPFSHAWWIEIQDLEQLNRLCQEIGLKLKKPGAPVKKR